MSFHKFNPNNFRPLSFFKNKDLNELNKGITEGRLFCDNGCNSWADEDIKIFCDDDDDETISHYDYDDYDDYDFFAFQFE